MPELPEVHTTATILHKLVTGLKIKSVWTDYGGPYHIGKDNIKDEKFFKKFSKEIKGAKIKSVGRRGKNVLINTEKGKKKYTILIHMKMTGHVLYGTYKKVKVKSEKVEKKLKFKWKAIKPEALKDPFNQFIHFVISLSNDKHIALSDMRKFAKVTFFETEKQENSPHLLGIGPEPISPSFSFEIFKERIMRRPKGRIKQVLMDPLIVAGIGNIYSDEILWASSIHPEEKPKNISSEHMGQMYENTKFLLKKGINFGGDSMSDYRNPYGLPGEFQLHHQAYRNTGKTCFKKGCKGTIVRKVVGGRSAHFCDTHQRLRK